MGVVFVEERFGWSFVPIRVVLLVASWALNGGSLEVCRFRLQFGAVLSSIVLGLAGLALGVRRLLGSSPRRFLSTCSVRFPTRLLGTSPVVVFLGRLLGTFLRRLLGTCITLSPSRLFNTCVAIPFRRLLGSFPISSWLISPILLLRYRSNLFRTVFSLSLHDLFHGQHVEQGRDDVIGKNPERIQLRAQAVPRLIVVLLQPQVLVELVH